MSYNPNVPLSSQQISSTTVPIQTNFTVANTNIGIDHVDFTNAAPPGGNGGLHNKSTYVVQGSDPTAVTQGPIVYAKSVSYPGPVTRNELFMRQASGDGGAVIQLTETRNSAPSGTNGYSFLPGGVIMQWGTDAAVGNNGTVTFPIQFPNACVNVQVTLNIGSSLSNIGINGFNQTDFTFRTSAIGNVPITFFAVGY